MWLVKEQEWNKIHDFRLFTNAVHASRTREATATDSQCSSCCRKNRTYIVYIINKKSIEHANLGDISVCKRRRTSSEDPIARTTEKKISMPNSTQKQYYAAIDSENLKLVYLRSGLVDKLSQQPETFEER